MGPVPLSQATKAINLSTGHKKAPPCVAEDAIKDDSVRRIVRLAYIHASPFCHFADVPREKLRYTIARSSPSLDLSLLPTEKSMHPIAQLNTDAEFRCLEDAAGAFRGCREGPELLLQPLTASVKSLRSLLTLSGAAILHFGGHGASDGSLLFERHNFDGRAHPVNHYDLGTLFQAGPKDEPTVLAFVSTCDSEQSGQAFVKAGVPHVVCISGRVRDDLAAHFTYQFYLALLSGKSVGDSFHIANESIRSDFAEDPWAHPPSPSQVASPSRKRPPASATPFLLLGVGNHRTKTLFPSGGPSSYQTVEHPRSQLHNVSSTCAPDDIVGREADAHNILGKFDRHPRPRIISLVGTGGVGKSALAARVCQYCALRRAHWDHIRWVDCKAVVQEHEDWSATQAAPAGRISITEDERAQLVTALARQLGIRLDTNSNGAMSTMEELADALRKESDTGGNPTLVVLDGLETLFNYPHLHNFVAALLGSFLMSEDVYFLFTSTMGICEVLFSAAAQSSFFILDMKEVVIPIHPLDDCSAKTMLTNCVSRPIMVTELGIDTQEYNCDSKLQMASFQALGNNALVKSTHGLPGKILALARVLENRRLDQAADLCEDAPSKTDIEEGNHNTTDEIRGPLEKMNTDQNLKSGPPYQQPSGAWCFGSSRRHIDGAPNKAKENYLKRYAEKSLRLSAEQINTGLNQCADVDEVTETQVQMEAGEFPAVASVCQPANEAAIVAQLMKMGFSRRLCVQALRKCEYSVGAAVQYCLWHSRDIPHTNLQQLYEKDALPTVQRRARASVITPAITPAITPTTVAVPGFSQSRNDTEFENRTEERNAGVVLSPTAQELMLGVPGFSQSRNGTEYENRIEEHNAEALRSPLAQVPTATLLPAAVEVVESSPVFTNNLPENVVFMDVRILYIIGIVAIVLVVTDALK